MWPSNTSSTATVSAAKLEFKPFTMIGLMRFAWDRITVLTTAQAAAAPRPPNSPIMDITSLGCILEAGSPAARRDGGPDGEPIVTLLATLS